MRYYVIINGVNSLTIQGLAISKLPSISKPIMRNMREEIDGRDGDITTELGYGAYDKSLEIGLFGNYDINEIIAFFNSKGSIVFSDEPDKYYNFEILEKIDFEKLLKFKTAVVSIHCQPFKFPLTETPQEIEYEYVEASGDSAFIDNTEAEKFKSVKLLGQTSQTTIDGRNLFDKSQNYAFTNAPNTWTITQLDTGLRLKSSLTSGSPFVLYVIKDLTNYVGKTVRLKCNFTISGNRKGQYVLGLCESDGSNRTMMVTGETSGDTIAFTIPSLSGNQKYLYVNLYAVALTNATANDYVDYKDIITTIDNADLTYVPYVGGVQSPNPSYPQNVNVVSGDNSIVVCGKNLFNVNSGLHYSTAANGTTSVYNRYNSTDYIPCVGGTAYNISGTAITTSDNNLKVVYFDENKGFISRAVAQVGTVGERKGYTSYAPNNAKYVMAQFYENITDGQFEKASSMTNYEPYVSSTYPIYLGVENLTSVGTDTRTYSSQYYASVDLGFTITSGMVGKKLSLSFDINISNVSTTATQIYSAIGYGASNFTNMWLQYNYTGTPSGDYKIKLENLEITNAMVGMKLYARFLGFNASSNATYTAKNIQLEFNAKANAYTPYGATPIELCKIGTYQDKIYKGVGSNLFDNSVEQKNAFPLVSIGNAISYSSSSATISYVNGCYVEANQTYIVSYNRNTPSNTGNRDSVIVDSNNIELENIVLWKNTDSVSFTPQYSGYLVLAVDKNSTNIQISKGTSVLPYEPYNAKDKWLLHKEIGKQTLSSDDTNIVENSSGTNTYRFRTTSTILMNATAGLCNNNNFVTSGVSGDTQLVGIISGYIYYRINKATIDAMTGSTSVGKFKNWLDANETNLYAPLINSTTTIITDETLISQLDALANGSSFEPQTNIFQSNNDYPFYMEIIIMKKDTNQATINNDGNIYSKPTIALVGTGIVNIYLNGVQMFQVDLSETNEITIDTEHMEAYNPNDNTLANRKVIGDYSKFKLDVGNNTIKIDGALTSATITNYKRWL